MSHANTSSWPQRPCPVCGAVDPRVLFRQQFETTDGALLDGYDVTACRRCGCGYADRIPDQTAFDRYYREMSKYEYHQRDGAESEFDRRRFELIADTIARHVPTRAARTLDVGCATGRLLADLRARGFADVVGVDPSPTCAAAARRLYGIDVRTMSIADLAATKDERDLIIMIGVLEHLRDVDEALAHLKRILAPGGLIYVEVPDAATFADWDNAPFQDFSTEHVNFFTPGSLVNLMGLRGFKTAFLEQNHREQAHATMMSNVSGLFQWHPGEPARRPEFDDATTSGLERYIARCLEQTAVLESKIDALVVERRPLLVWGAGTHTSRLLATSRLSEANIVAFIESNARYQGKTLHGRPIWPPRAIRGRSEPVLVSSRVFQQEIVDQIRQDLGCANELILLYRPSAGASAVAGTK